MEAKKLSPLPAAPLLLTLTRLVVPVCMSWRKTSETPFVSPLTRFVAAE